MTRQDCLFRWEDYDFNDSQRKSIIEFMRKTNLIVGYEPGFFYDSEKISNSKLTPGYGIFEAFKIANTKCVTKTELRFSRTNRNEHDDDSKFLAKYIRRFNECTNIVLPSFKRIYGESRGIGGRIYSPYQTMTQEDRSSYITICNAQTIEIDYPNNHLNILLALTDGLHGDRLDTDLYEYFKGLGLSRKIVKRAVSIMLNSERKKLALTSAFGTMHLDNDVAQEFIDIFYREFPTVSSLKTGYELGMKLQNIESDIAMDVLSSCYKSNIFTLPVHDSFIISENDKYEMKEIMNASWERIIKNNPNALMEHLK